MRGTVYKRTIWAIALLLLPTGTMAQEILTKHWRRTIPFEKLEVLRLENKYGDVQLTGWDRTEIFVEVTVAVKHQNREEARSLMDRIEIDDHIEGKEISVFSEIGERKSGFLEKYLNADKMEVLESGNISIDYVVHLPRGLSLDVQNSFGDLIVTDWDGSLKAVVNHGDIWINTDMDRTSFLLSYGKLKAKALKVSEIGIRNGSLDLEASESLKLESMGSTATIGTVGLLDVVSSKDDIKVDGIDILKGDLKFSSLQAQSVFKKVELTMKLAELRLASIGHPAANIVIDQESSDININITGFSFRFNALLREGLLRVPKTMYHIDSELLDKRRRIRKVQADFGKVPDGKITIEGSKGTVILNEQP